MSALQKVLVGVGFAKNTGRRRPCKVLIGDGLSGVHEIISNVMKLHCLQRPMGAEGCRGRGRRSKASRC